MRLNARGSFLRVNGLVCLIEFNNLASTERLPSRASIGSGKHFENAREQLNIALLLNQDDFSLLGQEKVEVFLVQTAFNKESTGFAFLAFMRKVNGQFAFARLDDVVLHFLENREAFAELQSFGQGRS